MTLYIIAGANGSGKTTFAKSFSNIHNMHFINADEIAKELDPSNITKHQLKAGRIFFKELHKCLSENNSFAIETTMSGKYLIKYILQAQQNGFEVELLYLFLERPQAHINRVANRVLNGGHHIPQNGRYYRSRDMFCSVYKDMVDKWTVYHNSDEVFEKVATKIRIFDNKKWELFQKETLCK